MDDGHHLLICTVGGTLEPIIATIRHWKPARVQFIASEDTRKHAGAVAEVPDLLQPGSWDMMVLADAQDFSDCVRRMRSLDEPVTAWRQRGPAYNVITDFTGGTKCMSAALSLVSRRWPCAFSYVGGSERTKGGTGIVVSGKEQTLVTQNPWNALGYQAIDDACLLFDQQAFMPAARLLNEARKAVDDESIKRTLSTFHQLCEGYGFWDRFQHRDAVMQIKDVLKNRNDLQAEFGATRTDRVLALIQQNLKSLEQIVGEPRSRAMVGDLLANASRRRHEARYDDAVARLYRAIESLAQLALAERHGIPSTDNVNLESIPESLRKRWESHAENGTLRLGLQDAYELLDALGDKAGKTFKELKLDDRQLSPLTARNHSILAHGFSPASDATFRKLWDAAMKLGDFCEQQLPVFPRLAKP
jgi:CRISPR-associated protein (TIGR02710 family)